MREREQEDLSLVREVMGTAVFPHPPTQLFLEQLLWGFFWAGFDVTFRDVEGGHCLVFKELTL